MIRQLLEQAPVALVPSTAATIKHPVLPAPPVVECERDKTCALPSLLHSQSLKQNEDHGVQREVAVTVMDFTIRGLQVRGVGLHHLWIGVDWHVLRDC